MVAMTSTLYERRPGWLTFAAVILFAVAFTRVISAINYFGDGAQINDLTNSIFGQHLWVWGVWDLTLALLAFAAAVSLLGGGGFGRVIAYVWAVWAIVESFLIIGVAPWFAAATIVLAALVIYGLAASAQWSEEN
jgi:hypothetical protein